VAAVRAGRRWQDLVGDEAGLIVDALAPGVLRLSEAIVSEQERSYFYLLLGRDADCLIDGGWGFCSSLGTLRPDASKPLLAIATHSHFDHIGLLHLAAKRFGHPAEAAVFADPDPIATQALPYLEGRGVLAGEGQIDPASVRQFPCSLDGLFQEGQSFDIGDRSLLALHTPGHSPGSLTIVDVENGLLFCADVVHDGHIWDDIPGADRDALLRSHERLIEVDFALACPGHGAILSRAAFQDRTARYRRDIGA
jgi:glyoxylase-like metal-dependent hydrolase (beta-lactamase superfamily II)